MSSDTQRNTQPHGFWSKLEPSPFPRVANIEENQALIAAGVPSFQIDPNKDIKIEAWDDATLGKHLRYMVDRCITIISDPTKAHPPTAKHHEAKDKLKQVDGQAKRAKATDAAEQFARLQEHVGDWLIACQPKNTEAHTEVDVPTQRRKFQVGPRRCFCSKKKAVDACRFTVEVFAERLEVTDVETYKFFVKQRTHTGTLANALQRCLDLVEGPVARCHGARGIFGWTMGNVEAGGEPSYGKRSGDADADGDDSEDSEEEEASTSKKVARKRTAEMQQKKAKHANGSTGTSSSAGKRRRCDQVSERQLAKLQKTARSTFQKN